MGLHFSKEEFTNRKEKILNSMKNEGLDALIMFRQESMYWLTGYDTFGYVFFQAEDGIRDSSTSRGLGDVYKRQHWTIPNNCLTFCKSILKNFNGIWTNI